MGLSYHMLWVGRRARDPLVEAAEGYLDRLGHYASVQLTRLKDGTLEDERRAMERHLTGGGTIVALDERGEQIDTMVLAGYVRRWVEAQASVVFVIGGADGLHPSIRDRAARTIALSRLTLPHRLAQVLLAEQLYRAHTILRGEPYHRA